MTTAEVRQKYLEFFASKGHKIIPSARLVPDNDPTTLFTGSGMQPLVPFLLGEQHPEGKRLVNSQKCFRSQDIDDVGDNRHTTFFEMLGNWSLGDYFKREQIPFVFEFLTQKIGVDPQKLFVTVFRGDEQNNIPKDTEAIELWKSLFKEVSIDALDVDLVSEADAAKRGIKTGERIFAYDVKKNWWSRSGVPNKMPEGEPGGPDSEIFYEFDFVEHDTKFGEKCHPNCDCGRFLEIGNSVFMEYKKVAGGFEKLPQENVDFGGGLERIAAVSQNKNDIFQIDTLSGIITTLENLSKKSYSDESLKPIFRIIADHIRSSIFLIGDGVTPTNSEQGYFVRRLLRRAIRFWDKLGIENAGMSHLVEPLLEFYKDAYPETVAKKNFIIEEIKKEEEKFRVTLKKGLSEFNKHLLRRETAPGSSEEKTDVLAADTVFDLVTTYGFPLEVIVEEARDRGLKLDLQGYEARFDEHKTISRAGSEQKFKGGLGDTSEKSLQYHTATHLLHKALRDVLGETVGQKGSNITPERLRFDFSFERKMTDEEKKRVEDMVNAKIKEALPVQNKIMPKADAEETGALHFFGEKYGDQVSVYYIGNSIADAYSKEYCGGPHVKNTSELLGTFKILKEEAVSAGVRRIKAVLE
jgi:alanyl-tRNA synthetase